MSDTPRTDARFAWSPTVLFTNGKEASCVDVEFARQLERELNAALERIKYLENQTHSTGMNL